MIPFNPSLPSFPFGANYTLPHGILKVNGIEGAKAYPIGPNSMVALFDQNDDLFYIKTTDSAGYPSIRTFSFVEVLDRKPDGYVTIEEFNKFKEDLLNGKQYIRNSGKKSYDSSRKQYRQDKRSYDDGPNGEESESSISNSSYE